MNALTESYNEQACDVVADLLGVVFSMSQNEKLQKLQKESKEMNKIELAQTMLKCCNKEVIQLCAIADGVKDLTGYKCTPVTIMKRLIEILSDPELSSFFL